MGVSALDFSFLPTTLGGIIIARTAKSSIWYSGGTFEGDGRTGCGVLVAKPMSGSGGRGLGLRGDVCGEVVGLGRGRGCGVVGVRVLVGLGGVREVWACVRNWWGPLGLVERASSFWGLIVVTSLVTSFCPSCLIWIWTVVKCEVKDLCEGVGLMV